MSQILTNIQGAATTTLLFPNGANGNGNVLDLSAYKGPVTFVATVGVAPAAADVLASTLQTSSDNSNWTNVTGGAFTAVTNAANASNGGPQVKSFDVRDLSRYVRAPSNFSAANIPFSVVAIGQKERV